MSGPNPGRKRPAGRAKGRPAKRRRLAAASQQLQAPVPASLAQSTGDVQNPPADTFQAGALPADGAYIVRFPQGEQSGDGVCLGGRGAGVGGGGAIGMSVGREEVRIPPTLPVDGLIKTS